MANGSILQAIFFDMDGVLVFSYRAWFKLIRTATLELGYPVVDEPTFRRAWGQGIAADVETFFSRHTVRQVEDYYAANFRRFTGEVGVNPEAAPVLAQVRKAGLKSACLTNTPRIMAGEILRQASLADHLDLVVSGDEVEHAKPDPEMVRLAANKLGVALEKVLLVGDSPYDVEAARRAPCRVAGLGVEGDFTLKSLRDLLHIIKQLTSR